MVALHVQCLVAWSRGAAGSSLGVKLFRWKLNRSPQPDRKRFPPRGLGWAFLSGSKISTQNPPRFLHKFYSRGLARRQSLGRVVLNLSPFATRLLLRRNRYNVAPGNRRLGECEHATASVNTYLGVECDTTARTPFDATPAYVPKYRCSQTRKRRGAGV